MKRLHHHHPSCIDEQVKERIQQIRQEPPEGLQRTPGPGPSSYYLQRDQALLASGKRLPRSTRTIWRILYAAGLIERSLEVLLQDTLIKVQPIKGLLGKRLPLDDSITLMEERARSSERQRWITLRQRQIQAR